ncbi:MAG: LiaF domain-containing protein [Dehalococcoidia bacterium]
MRRAVKVLGIAVVVQLCLYAAAQAAKVALRRRAVGEPDPLADEFDIVNIMEGTEFASRAGALRAGTVKNYVGGVEVDLTEVVLAPGGAFLHVETICGGTEVTVPRGWRVIVRGDAIAGSNELHGTPEDDLDADSPTLTIDARTVMGELEVRAAAPARMAV